MSASHALFDCSVPMKFVRPPGVELPDTPPATGSLAFTASGARGWASSSPCTAEDSTAGCTGCGWACGTGVPVGVERGDPWELDEDIDAARGMAECGQCSAGLAVPDVVEDRAGRGRFCVRR